MALIPGPALDAKGIQTWVPCADTSAALWAAFPGRRDPPSPRGTGSRGELAGTDLGPGPETAGLYDHLRRGLRPIGPMDPPREVAADGPAGPLLRLGVPLRERLQSLPGLGGLHGLLMPGAALLVSGAWIAVRE